MTDENASSNPTFKEFLGTNLKYFLPRYLFLVCIVVGVAVFVDYYHSASDNSRSVIGSGISVIFGAVIGAITIYTVQVISERRRERKRLAAEMPSLAYNATATLMECYVARKRRKKEGELATLCPEFAALARIDGALAQFELSWRVVGHRRRPRVAIHKLRQRINLTKEYFLSGDVNDVQAGEALDWILEQAEYGGPMLAAEAGIRLTDPARIAFVGFRKVYESDRRDLSFTDEDPPWESKG